MAVMSTRIVQTRYGKLQGLVLPMEQHKFLKPVEVFRGVPYATPPVMSNRFSPTRTPSPWEGVRIADTDGPVCPQRLPDIANETAALERMPRGRLEHLRRLLPLLRNQSEDCLYLNIYSPMQVGPPERLPVLVFVHGESYEWNAGNPYDGSVLASYASLVVVTINYRLGILGFLNANVAPRVKARVANYGLMDQIAALHWVQQNIAAFGGDPGRVTLLGHGTGAACIHFLMASPAVTPGLFQRTALLSGSALASWALVERPAGYAVRLARRLNCAVPADMLREHERVVDCLRDAPLEALLSADVSAPAFLSAFGPSVDGVVIRSDFSRELLLGAAPQPPPSASAGGGGGGGGGGPSKRSPPPPPPAASNAGDAALAALASQLGANRYDVLLGVVTSEALWRFSAQDIAAGFEGERRDRILRTYVRNAYTYHLQEILFTVVNEYTDWERTVQHPINTRDATVAALSDAEFVAPLVQTGDLLASAAANAPPPPPAPGDEPPPGPPNAFFYVFDYQTKEGDYPQRMGTVHGEELPYMLGAPLVDGFAHFPRNYTRSEVALAEAVLIYLGNFARTGNPNEQLKQEPVLAGSRERNRFRSIVWEQYDAVHQKYLEISMKPRMKNHFRAHQLSVWLRLIPELHRAGQDDWAAAAAAGRQHNLFRNHEDRSLYDGPVRPDPLARTSGGGGGPGPGGYLGAAADPGPANATAAYELAPTTLDTLVTTCVSVVGPGSFQGHQQTAPHPHNGSGANVSSDTLASLEAAGYAAYSTALSVTIAIGCSLLILNVLIFAGVYYQRDKTRLEVKSLQQQQQQQQQQQTRQQQQMAAANFEALAAKHGHFHRHAHAHFPGAASVVVDVEADAAPPPALLLPATPAPRKPPPGQGLAPPAAGLPLKAPPPSPQQALGGVPPATELAVSGVVGVGVGMGMVGGGTLKRGATLAGTVASPPNGAAGLAEAQPLLHATLPRVGASAMRVPAAAMDEMRV